MSEVRSAYNRYSVALYDLKEAIEQGKEELIESRRKRYEKNRRDYVVTKLEDLQQRLNVRYETVINGE